MFHQSSEHREVNTVGYAVFCGMEAGAAARRGRKIAAMKTYLSEQTDLAKW